MAKTLFMKGAVLCLAAMIFSGTVRARTEHMRIYREDPFAKEEYQKDCSICHANEDDKAELNDFGKAFRKEEYTITPELRKKFSTYFSAENGSADAAKPAKEKEKENKQTEKTASSKSQSTREFLKSLLGANYKIVVPARNGLVAGKGDAGKTRAAAAVEGSAETSAPAPAASEEIVVEHKGKRYRVNTKDKTMTEIPSDTMIASVGTESTTTADQKTSKAAAIDPKKKEKPKYYRQADVRLINLPTPIAFPKGSLWNDYTHRWPISDVTSASTLYGLDTMAIPAFGFIYGVTNRIHVGAYRAPTDYGRPIQLLAGIGLLNEQKGNPFSLMARVGIEGRDNFKRNFTTSFEISAAKSITRFVQIYATPTISLGDRPYNVDPQENAPGVTAYAMGLGATVQIRPSVSLMAEANYRLNEESRYISGSRGIRRPVVGFGVQKTGASRRHAYSLTFSNGGGTTMSERSQTVGLQGRDDTLRGLTIGFNLTRRIF